MNTPQAVDDYYSVKEDCIYSFDVMSNDLGGSAKILWSIDDTDLTDDGALAYDLLTQDTAASIPEYSDLGAKISIVSGKIRYDASVFNYLAAGQSVIDTFTYAIRLSNGTLSWATVSVTITGTNDGPTVSAADLVGSVTEDDSTPNLTDTGTITFDDVDLTNTPFDFGYTLRGQRSWRCADSFGHRRRHRCGRRHRRVELFGRELGDAISRAGRDGDRDVHDSD
jgi:VCBS repeat-containing protein